MLRLSALTAALVLAATPLAAQFEIGPILGAYVPTSDIALSVASNAFGANSDGTSVW